MELLPRGVQGIRLLLRVLQEAVEGWDDAAGHEVDGDAEGGCGEGVGRVEGRAGVGFVEVVADDGGFDEGLRSGWGRDLEGGDEAARVQGQEGGGFVVWVYLGVAVGDLPEAWMGCVRVSVSGGCGCGQERYRDRDAGKVGCGWVM